MIVAFFASSEIENFLNEDECEAIIELAEEKGMKKPAATVNDLKLPQRNDHSAFDKWDKDLDGFLSKEEVFDLRFSYNFFVPFGLHSRQMFQSLVRPIFSHPY